MKISIPLILAAASSVAYSQSISAAQTVSNINGLTVMAKDLQETAKSITLLSTFETSPEVVNGFQMIIKQADKDYKQMEGQDSKKARRLDGQADSFVGSPIAHATLEARQKSTYTTAEQTEVCNAFTEFVKVNQELLSIVIGKHRNVEISGAASRMAAVLRGVESAYDVIAFDLISEVPTCAAEAKEQKKNLDKSLTKAFDTYANGLP